MDATLAPALSPFLERGRMRFIGITGIPDPLLQHYRNLGAIVAGKSPWSVSRFWSLNKEHFFDLNFGKKSGQVPGRSVKILFLSKGRDNQNNTHKKNLRQIRHGFEKIYANGASILIICSTSLP
jgi:hypothetical protein